MVEFALLQMLLMCDPHFRSDVIVQPRYFAEVTCSHRLPQEKSEYCQQISQRKSLSVTSETDHP
jgi:hypothetical protein